MLPSVPLSNDTEIELTPSDELLEVMKSMFSTPLICCSEHGGDALFDGNRIGAHVGGLHLHRWRSNVRQVFDRKDRNRDQTDDHDQEAGRPC